MSPGFVHYRSQFVVGLRKSATVFICKTFNYELSVLPMVPYSHVVIFVGDVTASGIAVLVGKS